MSEQSKLAKQEKCVKLSVPARIDGCNEAKIEVAS
jgi:hypothetical protein